MWGFARRMLMLNTVPVCYQQIRGVNSMSRYESASHVFCRCQYHLIWILEYRYKILKGNLGKALYRYREGVYISAEAVGRAEPALQQQLGWAEIDSNIAENALRSVALGRKNWLRSSGVSRFLASSLARACNCFSSIN